MNSIRGTSLNIKENNNGNLTFSSDTKYNCVSSSYDIRTNSTYTLNSTNNIKLNSDNGNININVNNGELKLTSLGNLSNAIIIEATHINGGILQTAGTSGIALNTIDGDIDLLSKGSNINIGVSSVGTSASNQTQNLNMECFDNYNLNSGDMYFVSSDVISFISQTGDIQFGTNSGTPIIQFQNQNLLINQSSSILDYQLDVAITDESNDKPGYNGIVVNTKLSNVAADLTLQTSNTLGDGTQCSLSMGSFGSNNDKATFETYIAYQIGNVVIRIDGDTYNPKSLNVNNGKDFIYSDIGKQIYWETTGRVDTIIDLSSNVTSTNDSSNVVINGSYTGETSRVYLLQIDSLGTPNTFKWSNDGGNIYQKQLIPITLSPINLDSGLTATFAQTTGFTYNQQFIFQTKITALVTNNTSIPIPEILNILQPFHSYITTTTPSDIVIKTNNKEKMRITGDGSISINQQYPLATMDINSNYNKILHVNQSITGYQINPSICYLESGGYVLVWTSQTIINQTYNYDIIAQRYLADGSRYDNNFTINIEDNNSQTTPSIAGYKLQNSNHFLISWKSYNASLNQYYVYSKIYHNNKSITSYDIENRISSNTIDNVNCAGLYNGNYIIVWAEDNGSGKYSIYGQIIEDSDGAISSVIQISPVTTYSRNFPFVAGLAADDAYTPNGFVVGYMSALDSSSDPVYTISVRIFNSSGVPTTGEITITTTSSTNVSDGLVSVAEIKNNNINGTNGGFLISFYRSYQANTNLYTIGDAVTGLTSGSTAIISNTNFSAKQITLQSPTGDFLIDEELSIISTVGDIGIVIEKVDLITYTPGSSNIVITLSTGSQSIDTYRFNSNLTGYADALWTQQVNTSPLYNDLERFTSNTGIFQYKRPLAYVITDNQGTALVSWTTDSIPSVYYQLLNIEDGGFIGTEQKLTNEYDGLKQRNQVVTHLQSIQGNDYGFVIAWDNQSLDLQDTGIYQQLIGYKHNLLNLEDGNSNFTFTHTNKLGVGTTNPETSLHIKTRLSNGTNSNNAIGDPPNPATITLQNTSKHVITNEALQSIEFIDGSNNVLNKIQSINSLRYDDLYPQPTNLKGFYKFDSTVGSQLVDSSIFNHTRDGNKKNSNGILNNFNFETCWNSGIINQSLLFDGNNNYIFIDDQANNELNTILETSPKQMSISMWINIPTDIVDGVTYDIISNGGDLNTAGTYIMSICDIGSNGSMVLTSNIITHDPSNSGIINNIELQGSITLNDTSWHHIVETVSISGGGSSTCTISMYVDGVLNKSVTSSGDITVEQHGSDKTYIGSRDGLVNFYRGNMDELRIYNSILTTNEITQLYSYGNPNSAAKGTLLLTPNTNTTNNKVIVIDNNGRFNNLNSRPLPYKLLSGDINATKYSKTITGTNTFFTTELNIGDIIVLGENYDEERTVITITNDTTLILESSGFDGPADSITYKKVFKKPSIYSFFDNSDSHRGHIDNYGKLMIGNTKPSTLLEVSGATGNTTRLPQITLTNTSIENGANTRKTSLNFRGYDTSDITNANPFVNLGHIETSHYGTSTDNKATMRFFINDGSGTTETNALDITTDGISINESISLPITTTAIALLLNNTHYTVICNVTLSAFAITLPSSSTVGRIYILKKYATAGAFALTINPNGKQIDGSGSTYTVSTSFIKLQYDGTNWWVIG